MAKLLKIGASVYDTDEVVRELERLECEESLATFLRVGWKYIEPAPYVDGWVVDALADHLQAVCDGEIRKLLINIPPRSLKSTMCSVAFPAWVWAQRYNTHTSGPGVKFLHGSYADKLSLRDSVRCRRLIESAWYQSLWGNRFGLSGDQNAKHRFSNDKGGERLITSMRAGITGEGYNIGVFDDMNASNEMQSEVKPETVIDWWDSTMPTRMNDPKLSAHVIIQQRLAENDLTGHILEKYARDYVHLCLPMRYEADRSFMTSIGWEDPRTEEGELLWPERFGAAEVRTLEVALGTFQAAGQLQQRPEPKGGGIIKRDWWQPWSTEAFPALSYIVASLDTAYTEKTENDPSAMTVWGIFSEDIVASVEHGEYSESRVPRPRNRTYAQQQPKAIIIDAWREHLEIHKLVEKVAATCKKMKADRLLIEAKASGLSVAQEIRRLYHRETWAVQTIDPKNMDKIARLHSVAPLWEAGLVHAPERSWSDMVITEMALFPKGKRDDLTDTASMAVRHLRDLGLLELASEVRGNMEDEMDYRSIRKPLPLYPS